MGKNHVDLKKLINVQVSTQFLLANSILVDGGSVRNMWIFTKFQILRVGKKSVGISIKMYSNLKIIQ